MPVETMQSFAWSIVETVRHPLVILNRSLHVLAVNPAFYVHFPRKPSETIGHPLSTVLAGPAQDPHFLAAFVELLGSGRAFDGVEVRCERGDGEPRIQQFSARAIASDPDPGSIILLAVEDVTDRRLIQHELERVNAELERRVADRTRELEAANRELEAFSFSVSHDLRAPLRALEGFSAELLTAYRSVLDERGQHYLSRIQAASHRMAALIDDLLTLSRLTRDRLSIGTVDLSALARTVAHELAQSEPGRSVEVVVQPDLVAIGDGRLLRIAMENLLSNAWKFTSKVERARVEMGRTVDRDVPAFFVRDNGAGFDMAHAQRLFGAFQRLHSESEFPGTGVGLATVQRVVHRHGGDVWARGQVGAGATFFFSLPTREPAIA